MCVVLGAPVWARAQCYEVDPPPPPPPRHVYGAPIQAPILHRHQAPAHHTQVPQHPSHSQQAAPTASRTPAKTSAQTDRP
jgi:hypothetical protein